MNQHYNNERSYTRIANTTPWNDLALTVRRVTKIKFDKKVIHKKRTYISHWLSTESLFGTQDCPFNLQTESHDSPCLPPKHVNKESS